jgi:hypothetical protein
VIEEAMKAIAYYLGQYQPLEENNRFWGDGFTEWHNVARARPLYPGHAQPVLPGRFGFYNLRSDETILAQLDYAKEIGINAFCYWHYWFAGKRVLHRPLDRMIALPDRGVKVMLGWANESWTGIWHGLSDQVILNQTYNRDELNDHARLIASYINTDRYLKLEGLSPFLIYKPRLIPSTKDYLDELRERVRRHGGGDLYIVGNWGPGRTEQINRPSDLGLDAVVATNVGRYFGSEIARAVYLGAWHMARKFGLGPEIQHYKSTIKTLRAAHRAVEGTVHSTVVTGWDSTPRSGRRGLVLRGYNKDAFKEAAAEAIAREKSNSPSLLFIKSWNEWAEGNTVEPRFKETWSAGEVLAEMLSVRT